MLLSLYYLAQITKRTLIVITHNTTSHMTVTGSIIFCFGDLCAQIYNHDTETETFPLKIIRDKSLHTNNNGSDFSLCQS